MTIDSFGSATAGGGGPDGAQDAETASHRLLALQQAISMLCMPLAALVSITKTDEELQRMGEAKVCSKAALKCIWTWCDMLPRWHPVDFHFPTWPRCLRPGPRSQRYINFLVVQQPLPRDDFGKLEKKDFQNMVCLSKSLYAAGSIGKGGLCLTHGDRSNTVLS